MIDAVSVHLARLRWRIGRISALTSAALKSLRSSGVRVTLRKFLDRLQWVGEGKSAPITKLPMRSAVQPTLLFIDTAVPAPDRDSGSVRALRIMQICVDLGWSVVFMPDNGRLSSEARELLLESDIQPIGTPGEPRLDTWMQVNGPYLHAVFLARHHVATKHIALVKSVTKASVFFDTVDLHHVRLHRAAMLQADQAAVREAARVRNEEFSLITRADRTLVVSSAEADYLAAEGVDRARIVVLSNIHDATPLPRSYCATRGLLFVGGFQHHPNREAVEWLCKAFMPLLRVRLPGVALEIVGEISEAEACALRRDDIIVHGHVPDVEPYLARARISLAPLLSGAGVKGKINQAMSRGLPVVATSIAAEGMFLRHGHDALIADGAEAFANAVVGLYNNEALWCELVRNGYANIESHFSSSLARTSLLELVGLPA